MLEQTIFPSVAWQAKGKLTRRERFPAEMDAVNSWSQLLALIEPHYPKADHGTQSQPQERMLRTYVNIQPKAFSTGLCKIICAEVS